MVAGVPLLKKQSFVYSGEKLDFIWEEAGISLHFPSVACEKDIEISIKVMTNVEENCIMPHGYRLMPMASATYMIAASATLPAPVKVRMQHCALVEKEDSLIHMVAHSKPPYKFKAHPGKCPIGESYGEIETTEFCIWNILYNMPVITTSLATHVVYVSDSTAHIVVTKNMKAHRKAVREGYPKGTIIDPYSMRCSFGTTNIAFSEAEQDDRDEGWSIQLAPTPSQILINNIYGYVLGSVLPKVNVRMEWKGKGQPQEEVIQIRVQGGSMKFFPLTCKPP